MGYSRKKRFNKRTVKYTIPLRIEKSKNDLGASTFALFITLVIVFFAYYLIYLGLMWGIPVVAGAFDIDLTMAQVKTIAISILVLEALF